MNTHRIAVKKAAAQLAEALQQSLCEGSYSHAQRLTEEFSEGVAAEAIEKVMAALDALKPKQW